MTKKLVKGDDFDGYGARYPEFLLVHTFNERRVNVSKYIKEYIGLRNFRRLGGRIVKVKLVEVKDGTDE